MTEIKFHGYLSKLFDNLQIYLGRLSDILAAIDSIKHGFREKILELQKKGFNYCIHRENNIINIIPVISGCGRTFMKVLSIVLVVVGIILMFIPGFQPLGLNLISAGVQIGVQAFTPIPKLRFPSSAGAVGGGSFTVKKGDQNFIFQNKENVASQGGLVRLGYGKLKINSNLVSISIKNYSTNMLFESEKDSTYSAELSSMFLSAYLT